MNAGSWLMLSDALAGLRARPLRSLLALFSLALGMLALTLLLAALDALALRAEAAIRLLGVDTFALVAEPAADGRGGRLARHHAAVLAAALPGARVAHARYDRVVVPASGGEQPVLVVAADPLLAGIKGWRVAQGRLLDEYDARSRVRHAVVSRALEARHGWRIGQTVQLGEQAFTVAGVLAAHDAWLEPFAAHPALLGGEFAVVPDTLSAYWLGGFASDPGERVDALFVQVAAGTRLADAAHRAARLLAQPDLAAGPFDVVTPETLTAGIAALRDTLYATFGSVAALALVLGGTTLMSLMLANVRERVAEIGLRRALGARTRDVAALFVTEAVVLTMAAVLLGVAGATFVLDLAARLLAVEPVLQASTVLPLAVLGPALAVLFSWWPARVAAAIQPADALRTA